MSNSAVQEVVCLMGYPVAGNPSQYVMEKGFAAAGLDSRYLTFEIPPEHLADAMRGMRVMGFLGANFARPHKRAVIEHLDGLTDAARLIGGVNCGLRQDDEPAAEGEPRPPARFIGDNTDGKGFVRTLQTVRDPHGLKAVVLGAGNIARAVAIELALAGAAEIYVVNRTPEAGQSLVETINEKTTATATYLPWQGDFAVPEQAELLVNATRIGQTEENARVPLAIETLTPEMIVADVHYNPPNTRLIKDAAARECKVLDGLAMRVNQAAIAFRLWTGVEPDAALMRKAIEEFLGL